MVAGAEGLAADVRAYGAVGEGGVETRIGSCLSPGGDSQEGGTTNCGRLDLGANLRCPNPACGIAMPLVRSWWLGKKRGNEAFVGPWVVETH